jgi:ABC-type bacteriocin/lantibiotic exporter with double-glycine peptidase domain
LVLDEATSALDGVTEQALLANLKRASRGRTVIMVTHRLGALAIADRVLFLLDGRIQREGPPGEIAHFVLGRQAPGYPTRPRPAPV